MAFNAAMWPRLQRMEEAGLKIEPLLSDVLLTLYNTAVIDHKCNHVLGPVTINSFITITEVISLINDL